MSFAADVPAQPLAKRGAIPSSDNREGGMRNDILEMCKDPKRKADGDKLMAGRTVAFPTNIATNQWHHFAMEIVGDEMRVRLDEKPAGKLRSPGIGHPSKSRFHVTINGQHAVIDDEKIWVAETGQSK